MEKRSIVRTVAYAILAVGLFHPVVFGQDGESGGDAIGSVELPRGLHIYGASVYAAYMTTAYPSTGLALNTSSALNGLGPDENYGAQISVGWQRHQNVTDLSIVYSGGYSGMVHYSGANGLTQFLSIDFSRRLSTKWGVSLSASGSDMTLAQFVFQPGRLSTITQLPLSYDDFAAAFNVGQYSNTQIASMLTGSPILESPAQNLLLGERILSYSGQMGVSYSYSPRLQFHFGSFTASGESRLGASPDSPPANYVMPRTSGFNGGVGVSYMLSPRTTFGMDTMEYMYWNRFQHGRGTMASLSLGRKMTEHWFVRVYGGGTLTDTRSTGVKLPAGQVDGGGTLGVKVRTQTLAATYDRSSYDTFGFAAGVITLESASWSWHHPGSRWSVSASFGEEQMRNTGFASISGWLASGGLSFQLQSQMMLQFGYAHMRSAGQYNGAFNQLEFDSVRVSLGWSPGRYTR